MTSQRADLTKNNKSLVDKVLSDPSLFPDEFTSWLPRTLAQNINFQVLATQLPKVDVNHLVAASSMQNGWANYGGTNEPALYYKDVWDRVFIGGIVKSGTIGTTIFTLPAGYRPQYAVIFAVSSNDAHGTCTVNPDGTVVANTGSNIYFSLSGINFRQFA